MSLGLPGIAYALADYSALANSVSVAVISCSERLVQLDNHKRVVKLLIAVSAPLVFLAMMSFAQPVSAGCPENCSTQQDACLKRCQSAAKAPAPACTKICEHRLEKCKERCTPNPQSSSLQSDEILGQAGSGNPLENLAADSSCTNLDALISGN
jgi:hypothetical protein